MIFSLVVAAMLQAAPTAVAATPEAKPSVIVQPDWIRRPSGEEFARHFPKGALDKNLGGRVVMRCGVTAEGTLADCSITEESPPGEGFGEAALKTAPLFKLRPMTRDGQPVGGGTIIIPMRFAPPTGVMDPVSGMLACYGATSVAIQTNPADRDAMYALAVFVGQAAARSIEAGGTPESFERSLGHARTEAMNNKSTAKAMLRQCLSAVKK